MDVAACVHVQARGDVCVITIDNPPINATSLAVRQGLMAAISEFKHNADFQAAVIVGAGSTFVAGADIRQFGQPMQEPTLPDVIRAVEDCGKPVVAALHGAALGGGFELALACDARIAEVKTVVGLPEVSLGIIPGAGGTQLLPRRVGVSRAIRMICGAQRISAQQAQAFNLLDVVVNADVLDAAIAFARQMQGKKNRIRDELVPAEDVALIAQAAGEAMNAGKHRPAVEAAIEAIKSSATLSIEDGLADERAVFLQLRVSAEAHALRHVFFAERDCAKLPAGIDAQALPVQTVCVIGAGTMGAGIAISLLDAGLSVVLLEQDEAPLERGNARVMKHYRDRVLAQKMTDDEVQARVANLHTTLDWSEIGKADLVIEAVFEDLAVKQEVFKKIDRFARAGAVLATNTSYLDVDAIAQATSRPQDVLGLHFFSPAHVMKLIEVVRGKDTRPEVLATGMALGKRLRKLPVLAGNRFGFIGNRIYNAYRNQCEFMLEDGAWPEDVDASLKQFGMVMGPFAVADLSGLDIAWRMRQAQADARASDVRYVDVLDRLCEMGRMGRKTGAGYYTYVDGKQQSTTDQVVRDIIEDASRRRGLVRQPLSRVTIQRRAMLAIVNEVARLLAEGVAVQASDIDVVMVHGYGFPRWEGGPVHWARQQDRQVLTQDIQKLAAQCGAGFVVADLNVLFQDASAKSA
jgi:3-hydroxyacyl-CoA dehydrogenase